MIFDFLMLGGLYSVPFYKFTYYHDKLVGPGFYHLHLYMCSCFPFFFFPIQKIHSMVDPQERDQAPRAALPGQPDEEAVRVQLRHRLPTRRAPGR